MRNEVGTKGEDRAVEYLKEKGYFIIERNFRSKIGEIDIVALDQKTWCFIEVKTRSKTEHGLPCEAVSYSKQKKLSRLALLYLKSRFQSIDHPARFDVVSVVPQAEGQVFIHLIKNAFDLISF